MDTRTMVAVVISVVSLTVSGMLAVRQIRTSVDGYALPVVLGVFSQFRTQEFFDAQQFLFEELNRDYDGSLPYTDLPLAARSHLRLVAGLYDDLGKLVAHGIVREELVIGSNGVQARRIWEAVEPFVLAERRKRSGNLWIYLEDLAYRATRTPPQAIHAKLGLHRYPTTVERVLPRPRREPPEPSGSPDQG